MRVARLASYWRRGSAVETKPSGVIDYGARRRRFPWMKVGIVACLIAAAIGIY
jgi:hypothetical protein